MGNKMDFVWGFVEKYYPDYDHSDEIADEGDLTKLYNEEYQNGDCADRLLQMEYGGDIKSPLIGFDLYKVRSEIYEKAIEAYIHQMKPSLTISFGKEHSDYVEKFAAERDVKEIDAPKHVDFKPPYGELKTVEFETEAEKQAYIKGLCDSHIEYKILNQ